MNKKTILVAAGLGLAQLIVSQLANAQDSLQLKDVVISATKNDQKQSQTGKVVTIITSETLERSHGKSLPDLISEQAGIIVAGASSNPGLNKSVFFRGAGSAYAVVLIDGIVQNDPSGNGGAFDLRLFSIDQIDHIEILRGGQSTIYGSDAVAGVINIVTKKGGAKGNTIYGVASAGSYETYKGTIGLNGAVEGFTYNINYTHMKTDGISEAANPVGNTNVFDKDGFKTDGVNANFGIKLDKHFSINPFIRYYRGNYSFDGGAFLDANNYSILKNLAAGTNAKYEFATGKVTLNYSYESTINDAHSQYPSVSQGKISLIDLFYNQKLGNKLDLLVGIDNRLMKLSSGVNKPEASIFAAYGSLFLHDLSVFNLEVGGRYNKHEQYGENFTYSITPSINIIKEVKLFGTVSTAFKVPTLNMLFGQFGANLDLEPEKSQNYEAGVNFSFADDKFSLRIAGFKRDLKDAIIYAFPAGYVNQVSQKTKGFEVEPAVKLGIFTVNGYYAYVEGNEFNFVDNAIADYLFRRPKHTFGLNAGVQATNNLFVSANYRYFGKRTDGNFATYTVDNLPAYKLLNAYAEYALAKKRVKIFFDAKNILNEKYNEIIGYNSLGFNFNAGVSFNIR
ncbi:TonB-dependent receptor plug domain-containing protein [Pedobacter mucosus]|uniref:TonB-dependent receptor plug domain-containing protein n=1 Tax=Pedobacter mucosus TaxID=2895286 RepID=UPI001EE3F1C9|nr:TonB-dependent receptor [Pedobacter mucosus]UKT65535.1 TonB-dependent receptor [Pedobacter mucosus]